MTPQRPRQLRNLLERARRLAATGANDTGGADAMAGTGSTAGPGHRRILGIAGPPGAGKTTLAAHIAGALGRDRAVLVPMDGFHLADTELRRLGLLGRKGAPETFDPYGYTALLRRLRTARAGETVYAPGFDRELEQPVAGTIPVPPDVPLVITEGNYLLLDDGPDGPWSEVRGLLDETWWVDLADEERVRRLIARHERFGKPPAEAERFVLESDEANARLVAPGRSAADLVVTFADGEAPGDAP
ncbi:nucleoside/nucleotide kinase family protein [Streptomyces sp. NPDC059569]|uniref:nucleoside/nucleotide kinase family protein n=1 Tax=Streptomyces sp. NPDC059569 TaxID=3346869 RepID=UPI0036BD7919